MRGAGTRERYVRLQDLGSIGLQRPDAVRFLATSDDGDTATSEQAFRRYCAQGPLYQVPCEIPCDRTFAFSVAEVHYVGKMVGHLFGSIAPPADAFPLAWRPSLYLYPSDSELTREYLQAQKAGTSVMRITAVAMTVAD